MNLLATATALRDFPRAKASLAELPSPDRAPLLIEARAEFFLSPMSLARGTEPFWKATTARSGATTGAVPISSAAAREKHGVLLLSSRLSRTVECSEGP